VETPTLVGLELEIVILSKHVDLLDNCAHEELLRDKRNENVTDT